jgi:hypothetical protein
MAKTSLADLQAIVDTEVSVYFNSTAPVLTGLFVGFRNDYQFFIVQDLVDPTIEHLVSDFAYITLGPAPVPPAGVDVTEGELVEVTFDNQGPDLTVTGLVVAVDAEVGVVEIDDGVNNIICKDFWKIKRL